MVIVKRNVARACAWAALVWGGLVGAATPAAAGNYSVHVLGTTEVSWTDNLFAVPDDAADPLPPHEGDFLIRFRPGVLAAYETPRTIHNLEYTLDANLYIDHTEARSLGHTVIGRGFYQTSPRSEMQTSLTFATGVLASLSTRQSAGEGQPVVRGSGNGSFWSLDASQGLTYAASRVTRITQGLQAHRLSSTDALGADTHGTDVGMSLGADRGWKQTALAIMGGARYVLLSQGATDNRSIHSNLSLSVRRDLSPRWSAVADAGGAWIAPLDDANHTIQPTFGVNVSYAPQWGAAGFQLRRAMAPNLYIAENTITDTASANASLPLPWLTDDPNLPTLTVAGALGASRSQVVRGDDIASSVDVVYGDLAVTYAPRGDLTFVVRAQHQRQFPGESMTGMTALEYDRTSVIASVTWRFPERLAADIPMRDSLRVDRRDNTPVGDEARRDRPE